MATVAWSTRSSARVMLTNQKSVSVTCTYAEVTVAAVSGSHLGLAWSRAQLSFSTAKRPASSARALFEDSGTYPPSSWPACSMSRGSAKEKSGISSPGLPSAAIGPRRADSCERRPFGPSADTDEAAHASASAASAAA
jgi:hypothetical protein